MKKILFIKAAPSCGKPSVKYSLPLGIMYLAAFIRNKMPYHYEMKLADMYFDGANIREIILDFKPDIVACSAMTVESQCMHELAKLSKNIDKKINVIVGGPYPTVSYRNILEDKNIDIAVIGEGEETFYELLQSFNDERDIINVAGIAFIRNKNVIFTGFRKYIDNLDDIPFPAWDLIDINRYAEAVAILPGLTVGSVNKRWVMIYTSRGCPYQCIYCHKIFGKYFRSRTPVNVFNEIMFLYNKYDINEFSITDDVFNFDIKRAKEICDLIIESGIKIILGFPNGLRVDIMDEDLILKLKQAGCRQVNYAIETASLRMQKLIKKNINLDRANNIITFTEKQGLLTRGFFMFGFPAETVEDMEKSINFACNSSLTCVSFFIVLPYEDTELFEMIKIRYPSFRANFSDFYSSYREYSMAIGLPLIKIRKKAYLKFYLNPVRLVKLFKKLPDRRYPIKLVCDFIRNFLIV